jgi:hypothetical protein
MQWCFVRLRTYSMLSRLLDFLRSLVYRAPVHLAIVRRYQDANGNYVGELYREQPRNGISSYGMVGASLDSFPLGTGSLDLSKTPYVLDVANDFLALMPANRLRVGAMDPKDNDAVRRMIGRLPRRRMTVVIQNRFIEHVLENKA